MRLFFLSIMLISINLVSCQKNAKQVPTAEAMNRNTISFYAKDSVLITADTYFLKDIPPTVLLCHQAGFSRGEYMNTAKKLNDLGFSCLAIDQRSGKEVNGIVNQTALDADSKLKNVGYTGAKQDIDAAIDYLYNSNGNKPVIVVGSSYSASLALWIATENSKVKAVAAFSPGEYLTGIDLADKIRTLHVPAFVTSSKRETPTVEKLIHDIDPEYVTQFKSTAPGIHGSRALWETTEGHQAYWEAFKKFMLANK